MTTNNTPDFPEAPAVTTEQAPKAKKAKAKSAKKAAPKAKAKKVPAKKNATKRAAKPRDPNAVSKSVIPLDVAKSYQRTKDKAGKLHITCGDEVAELLLGKDLDAIYVLTAKKTGVGEKDLRTKYAHLNPGMQRMNLGNKLRAALSDAE